MEAKKEQVKQKRNGLSKKRNRLKLGTGQKVGHNRDIIRTKPDCPKTEREKI